jgi:hypothetical protein
MEITKRCSGCKETKSLNQFYKNKLVLDGHSNYCVTCTKENSKKYFQRKKDKVSKVENDNLMKMVLLSNYSSEIGSVNTDNLMRVLMIDKMCKSMMNELNDFKKSLTKTENVSSE